MINEITLLHMVVLIWWCVFTRLFSQKILILNTDTSVFFRYWYWYCFSIFHIEYWNWYFSILKAYWILNTSTFILYWSVLWCLCYRNIRCKSEHPAKNCKNTDSIDSYWLKNNLHNFVLDAQNYESVCHRNTFTLLLFSKWWTKIFHKSDLGEIAHCVNGVKAPFPEAACFPLLQKKREGIH